MGALLSTCHRVFLQEHPGLAATRAVCLANTTAETRCVQRGHRTLHEGVTPCLLLRAVLLVTRSPASPITLTPSLAGMGSSSPTSPLAFPGTRPSIPPLNFTRAIRPGGGDGGATSPRAQHLSGLLPCRQSSHPDKFGLSLYSPPDMARTAKTAPKPHY